MSLIGYARVSSPAQDPALQVDALTAAGCERMWVEHASGARADRPELAAALDYARAGDVLVVWRLDRLGRSLAHLLELAEQLRAAGVGLRSLSDAIDTTTAGGRMVFAVFGALAEFERELIRERTQAGLAAARARGRLGGQPRKLDAKQRRRARTLYRQEKRPVTEIAAILGVGRATVYRALQEASDDG